MDSVLILPYLENKLSKETILRNTPRRFVIGIKERKALVALKEMVTNAHKEYVCVLNELLHKEELNRAYISSLYSEKPFHEAVFATLIWGGLNRANMNLFLDNKVEEINTKIQRVKAKLCDEGDIKAAFESMLDNKENHINGVGVAFFTKILYFLASGTNGIKPLIFDKWTQTIHAVSLPDDGSKWYKLSKTETGSYNAPSFVSDSVRTEAYLDFITRMHNLSLKIGMPSGLIEEYLFGSSKKFFPKEWNDNNPRKKLVDYVIRRPSCKVVLSKRNSVLPVREDSAIDISTLRELAEKWYHTHNDIGKFDIGGVESGILLEVPLKGNQVLRLGYKKSFYFCGIYDHKAKTDIQEYPELSSSMVNNGIVVGRYFRDSNKTNKSFELFKSLYDKCSI